MHLKPGYFEDEERTSEVFVAGYYRTGDVAEWTALSVQPPFEPTTLKVLGRVSEAISLNDGSLMFPGALEAILESSSLIDQSVVLPIPDGRVGLVVIPSAASNDNEQLVAEALRVRTVMQCPCYVMLR